jgi:hypothetical protein
MIPHCKHHKINFDHLFEDGKAGKIVSPEAKHIGEHKGAACDLICGGHNTEDSPYHHHHSCTSN